MSTPTHHALSRRERQIMDILYRRGRARRAPPRGAQVGAPPCRRDLLRRVRRKSGHRAPRRRGGAPHRRRARSPCGADCESAEGGIAMNAALEVTVKVSLVLLSALAA